jgi:nitrogen PTS system EIIA component
MDLKIKDVAELLNVSETTVKRWLTTGEIPAYYIGEYRFNRNEIEDWVMKQKLVHPVTSSDNHSKTSRKADSHSITKGGIKQYSLYRAVHKGGVLYDIPGNTKEEVIRSVMKRIASQLNLDADVLTDLLLDRENLQSTGLGNGIGLPHTRDHLLNTHQDVVVVAFPEKPINYGSLDGKPVHTLFFLFACDDKRHLNLLYKIAHLVHRDDLIEFLQSKPSKESVLEYIKNWEGGIQNVHSEN